MSFKESNGYSGQIKDDSSDCVEDNRRMLAPRFQPTTHTPAPEVPSRCEDVCAVSFTTLFLIVSFVMMAFLFAETQTNVMFYIPFGFLLLITLGLILLCGKKVLMMKRGHEESTVDVVGDSTWVRTSSIEHMRLDIPQCRDDLSESSLAMTNKTGTFVVNLHLNGRQERTLSENYSKDKNPEVQSRTAYIMPGDNPNIYQQKRYYKETDV